MKTKTFIVLLLLAGTCSVKAQVAKTPFSFSGTHLFINAQIGNSDTLRFIFDSGSTGAIVDSAAAEKARVSKEGRQKVDVGGNGGTQSLLMAMNQNVRLEGGLNVTGVNPLLMDFTALSKVVGEHLDGIIGFEVLNQYVTRIDFDKKMLTFYHGIKETDTTGYTGIPFEFSKNINIARFPISVTLANGETFTGRVMFDLGNAGNLLISTPFSKFHDFNSKIGKNIIRGGHGVSAETQEQVALIKSMNFNGFDFGPMVVQLTINEQAQPKDGYLGILGIGVLKRFNIIVDYANKKIYLKPNKAYKEEFGFPKGTEELKP